MKGSYNPMKEKPQDCGGTIDKPKKVGKKDGPISGAIKAGQTLNDKAK